MRTVTSPGVSGPFSVSSIDKALIMNLCAAVWARKSSKSSGVKSICAPLRPQEGEQIGITRRGKLAAVIAPARRVRSVEEIFADIEDIRKRVTRSKKFSIKELIEEGRV